MNNSITKDDALFFMHMVSYPKRPNRTSVFNQNNPYYKILDNRDSYEFLQFIKIYNYEKHILKERERQILDALYGVNEPKVTMKQAGLIHHISQERVRQIRQKAEWNIADSLMKQFKYVLK